MTTQSILKLTAVGFALAASYSLACSTDDSILSNASAPGALTGELTQVSFGEEGQLASGMTGQAWVSAGELATVDSPNPCNETEGCFKDVKNGLCTKGRLPALQCVEDDPWNCNYGVNWGVMVGLTPAEKDEPWGDAAASSITVGYEGEKGNYRLVAHVAGDPKEKVYCIDGYTSGVPVGSSRFTSECWAHGGTPLPSFAAVDAIGLMLTSEKEDVAFDYCVSDVVLNAPLTPSRVLVGHNGKLSGAMEGYAWVAGADQATIASPNPCDRDNGCFQATSGKLCIQGSLPALECTGKHKCNWDQNWGAMIGMNPTGEHTAWGEKATEKVAFEYEGGEGTYQVTAHVVGDPDKKVYCIRGYRSGQAVTADQFQTECWSNSGHRLSSFTNVDSFGLMVISEKKPVDFDYCISEIRAM
jgi:hypothetical protein